MKNDMGDKAFKVGDSVVYATHGVGKITEIEEQVIAGIKMELFVIYFPADKMTLRIPRNKALKAGLRQLTSTEHFEKAIAILKEPAQVNKMMWSKKSQELETKINSGSIVLLAEVLRDLYRDEEAEKDRPYSERVLYSLALERFANEYSIAFSITNSEATEKILDILEMAQVANKAEAVA